MDFFPVTHSILSSSALLEQVLPAYDLGRPRFCRFLQPGVNDTYLVQDDRLWQAFLGGYMTERPLSDADLAAIPYFVMLRELWHLGLEVMP